MYQKMILSLKIIKTLDDKPDINLKRFASMSISSDLCGRDISKPQNTISS